MVAATRRVGLTPTGSCARAALAVANAQVPTLGNATASGTTRPLVSLPDPRREALAQLQAELAATRTAVVRVGTNLNQAVRVLNATGCGAGVAAPRGGTLRAGGGAVDAAASMVHRRL